MNKTDSKNQSHNKQKQQKHNNYNKVAENIENKIIVRNQEYNQQTNRVKLISIIIIIISLATYFIYINNLYCFNGYHVYDGKCIKTVICNDGTLEPECSLNKPFMCINGTLIESPDSCGCPEFSYIINDTCKPLPRCSDGTPSSYCSDTKPLFCFSDNTTTSLINKSSECGCPDDSEPFNDTCILIGHKYPIEKTYKFQRFIDYEFVIVLHSDMYKYYSDKSDQEKDFQKHIDDDKSDYAIDSIIKEINEFSDINDTRIELITSFVQHISTINKTKNNDIQYPYETLYLNNGTSLDKSLLLAKIISRFGYGTALLRFSDIDHTAIGIKCPEGYGSLNTEYCFIELIKPHQIGNVPTVYDINISLESEPEIIKISDGLVFEKVKTYPKFMVSGLNSG